MPERESRGQSNPALQRRLLDTLAALLDPITGTVRGLARFRNGARVKEYNEAPWGDAVADTGLVVRYRFAGREWDQESGLYYMRARYYDPTLGRWVSEDPLGLGGGGNLFGYAGGDPVNGRDPSGLEYRWTSEGYCQEMANVTWHTVDGVIVGYTINYKWKDCIPSGDLMGGDPTNANKGQPRADQSHGPDAGAAAVSACGWAVFDATVGTLLDAAGARLLYRAARAAAVARHWEGILGLVRTYAGYRNWGRDAGVIARGSRADQAAHLAVRSSVGQAGDVVEAGLQLRLGGISPLEFVPGVGSWMDVTQAYSAGKLPFRVDSE